MPKTHHDHEHNLGNCSNFKYTHTVPSSDFTFLHQSKGFITSKTRSKCPNITYFRNFQQHGIVRKLCSKILVWSSSKMMVIMVFYYIVCKQYYFAENFKNRWYLTMLTPKPFKVKTCKNFLQLDPCHINHQHRTYCLTNSLPNLFSNINQWKAVDLKFWTKKGTEFIWSLYGST